jgi:hypothetical protein
MSPWVFDPGSGGKKVPPPVQQRTRQRILAHAESQYKGHYTRLDIRFRGPFCYIDAYREPRPPWDKPPSHWTGTREEFIEQVRNTPIHLVRLRFFGDEERWGLAFYTYSNEKYELCVFPNGEFLGPPEAALDIGAVYLHE